MFSLFQRRISTFLITALLLTLTPTASADQIYGNVQDLQYAYDAYGNIIQIENNSIINPSWYTEYSYDDLNRILSAESSGFAPGDFTEAYTYDALGNMLSRNGTVMQYGGTGFPTPNAPTNVGGLPYTYDLNGNLLSDGTQNFTWTIKDELQSSGDLQFFYDHTGTRVRTVNTVTGDETIYVSPYLEIRNGVPIYYFYADGERIASLENGVLTYFHQDHLGGVALATDEDGRVVQVNEYYPFGSELISDQKTSQEVHYSFGGKELEEDMGLSYFEARWYDAETGKFVSMDPMLRDERLIKVLGDPQSFNAYAYARNNPLTMVDPSGELSTKAATSMLFSSALRIIYFAGQTLSNLLKGSNPITSSFLQHSLSLNPGSVQITEKNQSNWGNVIDSITATEEFQTEITRLVSYEENAGNTTMAQQGIGLSLNETSDLKMAVGTAGMNVTGTRQENGSWNLNVSITDTYHFEQELSYPGATYNSINKMAAGVQDMELVTSFKETINFNYTHEE